MSTEFGIFNDEGKVEGQFYSIEEAAAAAAAGYTADDAVHVAACCPDHPDHERETCEACNTDE